MLFSSGRVNTSVCSWCWVVGVGSEADAGFCTEGFGFLSIEEEMMYHILYCSLCLPILIRRQRIEPASSSISSKSSSRKSVRPTQASHLTPINHTLVLDLTTMSTLWVARQLLVLDSSSSCSGANSTWLHRLRTAKTRLESRNKMVWLVELGMSVDSPGEVMYYMVSGTVSHIEGSIETCACVAVS
jgi:hypothetical protein